MTYFLRRPQLDTEIWNIYNNNKNLLLLAMTLQVSAFYKCCKQIFWQKQMILVCTNIFVVVFVGDLHKYSPLKLLHIFVVYIEIDITGIKYHEST